MSRLSAHPRRSRLQARRSREVRIPREETVLFSARRRSGARHCWVYSLAKAVKSEILMLEPGRAIEAVVPRPCPWLEMSVVPPFALTKVDAIQKPNPDPG